MKSGYLKKLAAGVLVAAMAVTAVPAVSQVVNPTVTAQAAKKKAKKTNNAKVAYLGSAFDQNNGMLVGKQRLWGSDLAVFDNYKANGKYTFTTNSKNLSIKLDNSTIKAIRDYYIKDWTQRTDLLAYNVTAKKPGTYKVTIKEKYKGKTRTLKKNAKLYVYEPEAASDYTAYIGNAVYDVDPNSLLKNSPIGKFNWDIVEGENTVLTVFDSERGNLLRPVAEGKGKVRISDRYGKNCGTVSVTVKANHCARIGLSDDAHYYDDDDNQKTGITITRYSDETAQEDSTDISDYYYLDGENEDYTVYDPVTVTSSNPAVVSVSKTDSFGESDDDWYAAPQSEGDAVLTITCGSQSVQLPVHVNVVNYDD